MTRGRYSVYERHMVCVCVRERERKERQGIRERGLLVCFIENVTYSLFVSE